MNISFNNALGMREEALTLRAERASVLSSNLANADTPNFKARDLNFSETLKARMDGSGSSSMKTTRVGHVAMSSVGSGIDSYSYRTPNQPSLDGNTVEEQVEHAQFMKNNLEFQAAFTMLDGSFKGLRKAITGQ